MPTLTNDELALAIAAGEIQAVSIDTCIFDRYHSLRHRTIRSLEQFRGTNTNVVVSEIVMQEMKGHISAAAKQTLDAVRIALEEHRKAWNLLDSVDHMGASAHINANPDLYADAEWSAFADATDLIVVPVDGRTTSQVVSRYFLERAPFGSGKKRHEFPDAIALLSIEAWAIERNTKVLMVSTDSGWQAFAAESSHLVCVTDIAQAVDPFNKHIHFIAERIVAMLVEKRAPDLDSKISDAVEHFFDDTSLDIHADAHGYEYEAELQGGALQYWTLDGGPQVLKADDDEITFVIDLVCKISFDSRFRWYVYADRDWHGIGATNHTVENEYCLQFSITCSRNLGDEEPDDYEVTITSRPPTIDFGYVEPGWDYEE